MSASVPASGFGREVSGWALRGTLCALSSLYWACIAGFQRPAEIFGMLTGVTGWVMVFSWFTFRVLPGMKIGPEMVPALKKAAWIKFGLTCAGWLLFISLSKLRFRGAEPLATIGMIDLWLGLVAIGLANYVGGFRGEEHIASLDSYGWTAFTTFIDGALFFLVIGMIAGLILGWRRITGGSAVQTGFSPVRQPD